MQIETIPIDQIQTAEYNPRKDLQPGDPEYQAIKNSIERWTLLEPLIWNRRTGNLVGGHQRLKILQETGATEVAVSQVDLDPAEEKALNLALNKAQGAWDEERLVMTIEELIASGQDLTGTGFTEKDLDRLLSECQGLDFSEQEAAAAEAENTTEHTCPKCGFEF